MNETYRNISVVLEIERSIKYLRNGLAEIQKISATNDFYDPVFLYLSSGLERLFKSMLCLSYKEIHGRLPRPNEIWNNRQGHDIEFLKSRIENICIPYDRRDYELLTQDEFINSICKVLSEFGKRSRYFNLDAILGVDQDFDSKIEWEKLETEISKETYGVNKFFKLLKNPLKLEELYVSSNKQLVIKLELFFRAITRQFIFGNFSNESKTFIYQIQDFTDIEDDQLGKTNYSNFKNHERIKRK
jgi:hypothetical protein